MSSRGPADPSRAGASAIPEPARVAGIVGSSRVDGMPVVFAERKGPVTGGLMFRVGYADEPLASAGISHLVEHLALFGADLEDVHQQGTTDEFTTHFHASGSEQDVVRFLSGVCAALGDLPLDRMETEKEILRTEVSGRGLTAFGRHRLERYGARGPGLAAYEGFGLSRLGEQDVADWVAASFTRDNAVAWITTDRPPDGLDLSLPQGMRRCVPRLHEVPPRFPCYFRGAQGAVIVDATVPRTSAAPVFAQVMSRLMFRTLRQEEGVSYATQCEYEPIDGTSARITVFADALPEKQSAVIGGIVDVLAALRSRTLDAADLAAARQALVRQLEVPSLGAALLPAIARNLLIGGEILGPADMIAGWENADVADISTVAEHVWRSALAQIPEGDLDWAGFTLVPPWSPSGVTGRTYPRHDQEEGALVIGDHGVSARYDHGVVTVPFDECEALEVWPDGARRLTGAEGFQIAIEPTLHFDLDPQVIEWIDARVPPRAHVPRPARDAGDVPRPAKTAPAHSDPAPSAGSEWRPRS